MGARRAVHASCRDAGTARPAIPPRPGAHAAPPHTLPTRARASTDRPPSKTRIGGTRHPCHGHGCEQPITKAEPLENQLADWLRAFQPDEHLRTIVLDTITRQANQEAVEPDRRAALAEQVLADFSSFWEREHAPAERHRLLATLFSRSGKTAGGSWRSNHNPPSPPTADTPNARWTLCGARSGSHGTLSRRSPPDEIEVWTEPPPTAGV